MLLCERLRLASSVGWSNLMIRGSLHGGEEILEYVLPGDSLSLGFFREVSRFGDGVSQLLQRTL